MFPGVALEIAHIAVGEAMTVDELSCALFSKDDAPQWAAPLS